MKRPSNISNKRALLVVCTLGFLGASTALVAAQAMGPGGQSGLTDPGGALLNTLPTAGDAPRGPFKIMENESPRPTDRKKTGKGGTDIGAFEKRTGGKNSGSAKGLATVDLDADGLPDLVKRPGTTGQNKTYYIGTANGGAWKKKNAGIPVVGDWDGDGKADLKQPAKGSQSKLKNYEKW